MSSYEFLSQLLVAEFGVRPGDISPSSTPTSLGLDSLSMAELIREIEEEYGIEVSAEQARFETLGEAAALVDDLIGGAQT
jgi:acyl carrier protein